VMRRSARTLAPQNDLDGLYQDCKVKQQTVVLHVEQIVLQLFGGILFGRTVRIA
jgi:hypothetical protein